MQTEPSPPRLRRLTAALVVALVALACTPAGEDTAPQPTQTADPVLQSRQILGEPTVQLAEAVIRLADDLAAARYETERGGPMRGAVRAITGVTDDVRAAADAADTAADRAPVERAVEVVRDGIAEARAAVEAAEEEVAFLRQAARVDAALLRVAGMWDEPGSQSEIRSRLDAAAADVARLRRRARALEPAPDGCPTMKRNRIDWASTVRTRTQALQSQANSAGGGQFDELRAAYRRLPLGVEPRSADQQERRCWRESSQVWTAADELRGAVEALEATLQ